MSEIIGLQCVLQGGDAVIRVTRGLPGAWAGGAGWLRRCQLPAPPVKVDLGPPAGPQ